LLIKAAQECSGVRQGPIYLDTFKLPGMTPVPIWEKSSSFIGKDFLDFFMAKRAEYIK
jgi:hypothetical protein